MSKQYKSDLAESIHQSALALFRVGAIDRAALSDFEANCFARRHSRKQQHTSSGRC